MSKKLLFTEESDEEDKVELKTNENYAKVYNEFRKKELLQKCKFATGSKLLLKLKPHFF